MTDKILIMSPLTLNSLNKARASVNFDNSAPQPDLLYMKSVLVSTGQNKNDDVFLPEEMWKARSTPNLKPVNWEHNTGYELVDSTDNSKKIVADNQIIGVMYKSYPAFKDGSEIKENAEASNFEIPSDFDIVTEAAIYKYLFPNTASRLVAEAQSNKLFVSMEAWFSKFDYRIGNKIVARNEQTAFLDNFLRTNGGEGLYNGQKVGRVLRDFVFGGVGIVSNPANDDSIINSFTNAELHDVELTNSAIASNIIGIINKKESQEVRSIMSVNDQSTSANQVNITHDDYKGVVERLVKAEHTIEVKESELAKLQAELDSKAALEESAKSAFVKGTKVLAEVLGDGAEAKLASSDAGSLFATVAELITNKLEKHDEVIAELNQAKSSLQKLEDERRLASRLEQIRDTLGLASEDKEQADKLIASTEKLDEDAFASWLANMSDLFSKAAKKAQDMPMDKKKKQKMQDQTNCSTDEGITDVSVLDNAQATASVDAGVENALPPVALEDRMQTLAAALFNSKEK